MNMRRMYVFLTVIVLFFGGCRSGSNNGEMAVSDANEKPQKPEAPHPTPSEKEAEKDKKKSSVSSMTEEKEIIKKIDSMQRSQPAEVTGQAMSNIVKNIASPVEMAALIKSMGADFTADPLAETGNTDRFISNYSQAFNLGIYGADLGYINMYQKKSMVLEYVRSIKKLADQLNVGQFFDFALLKRLAQNSENLDSLMYISIRSFNNVENYLRKNNRSSISAVIIAGAWIEGLYLISEIAEDRTSEKMKQSIGEQKVLLNQMMLILENFSNETYIKQLVREMDKIQNEFEKVKITIEVGEPKSVVKDGKLTIVQNEKSVVHMSDECLENIITKTHAARNKLIDMK